ncbi:MAG: hydrogenase maturation protease [bacterium]
MNNQLSFNSRENKTIIIGLGNTILCDDGVGIYVVRELVKIIDNPNIIIREASMGGLELIDSITGYKKVILIDSFISENNPLGTVLKLKLDDIKGGTAWTRHQVSLHEAIELANKVKIPITNDIEIYGVTVKDISTFSEECTPEITLSLPAIVEKIKNKILI